MNQQNVDFLKDRLFFLGFGDNLHKDLEKKLAEKPENFKLSFQGEFGKDDSKKVVDYTLDLSKSKREDMYFLNNYTATLKNEDPDKEKTQKFFLNNGSGVTAREAFNLLEGRAVYKTLTKKKKEDAAPGEKPEKYDVWMQLDFKNKNEYGNHKQQTYSKEWKYDLDKNLAKHPIKELTDPERKGELIKSLQKGNLQQVTFTGESGEKKMFVEANPKERNVNVYDENMRKQFQGVRQNKSESKSESQQQSQGTDKQKQENKNAQKSDDGPARKKKGMAVH